MEIRNTGTKLNLDPIPAAMTIAGSDSGGGAGIQADLRTFTANGVFGTSVITAVTSQNPKEVTRVGALSTDSVRTQIQTVRKAINILAVKTGMLFSANIIDAVADEISDLKCPLVVDPVMISTSGVKLLKDDALRQLQDRILPLADWITPNMPEAEQLSGIRIDSMQAAARAAEIIAKKWDTCVIVKGGHAEGSNEATDIICDTVKTFKLTTPRLDVPVLATHGTGCTFSAALAAALAKREDDLAALISAKAFVLGSLAEARSFGLPGSPLAGMFPPKELEKYKQRILIGKL